MRPVFVLIITMLAAACSGPLLWLPGGHLSGPEAPLNLNEIPAEPGVIQLETNPSNPYSVNVGVRTINGQLYIDPATERKWYQHIQANPKVRLRFDGAETVLTATAVPESDPAVLNQFETGRIVLRLAPRS
jgi:hypothetical protein